MPTINTIPSFTGELALAPNGVAGQSFRSASVLEELTVLAQSDQTFHVELWNFPMNTLFWQGSASVSPFQGLQALSVEPHVALPPGQYIAVFSSSAPFQVALASESYVEGRAWLEELSSLERDLAFRAEFSERDSGFGSDKANVPEPAGTAMLMGLGLVLIAIWRRFKR